MREYMQFYIDGAWVAPVQAQSLDVINPASEAIAGRISVASVSDVDIAAKAARRAFAEWSRTTPQHRIGLLERIVVEYRRREAEIAEAITEELGAPLALSRAAQAKSGISHLEAAIRVLKTFAFAEMRGPTRIVKEPIGVCGLITPWNWPMNQIACKVAPALATGCTMILKPSEIAPFSAYLFAEVLDAAGVPPGVFNLVNGGPSVGAAISSHREVDMVSFTGSTRAGVAVAIAAAPTVKRVTQELGGKSPIILLEGADFPKAVAAGVRQVMNNSGQSCNAPTRMIVPLARMDEVIAIAKAAVDTVSFGDPVSDVTIGPVVSIVQWEKVQGLIAKGVAEGATLIAGGPGRPLGLAKGYYVKPTIFANVTSDMSIAREEIFGPVLSILGYGDVDQAIQIANDTEYGLAAYLWGADYEQMQNISTRLRTGRVSLNGAAGDILAPFGGYKMSGNGREWGEYGFDEYVEVKAVLGYDRPT